MVVPHEFFEQAMHPDILELQRRDTFLSKIQEEYGITADGSDPITDVVITIPDIDVSSLHLGGA